MRPHTCIVFRPVPCPLEGKVKFHNETWYVECPQCKARGPNCSTKKEAIEEWNKLWRIEMEKLTWTADHISITMRNWWRGNARYPCETNPFKYEWAAARWHDAEEVFKAASQAQRIAIKAKDPKAILPRRLTIVLGIHAYLNGQ